MKYAPLYYSILFALAHTQSPLYYSNQNQYFLHPAAKANFGDLSSDWLANTADPVPLFSMVASWGLQFFGDWTFQLAHFLAQMLYFLAAWWLVKPSRAAGILIALVFTVLHAGLLRWASDRLVGADYLWFLQCGLANQYILGPGLQPSVVGVLLLLSVAAYRNEYLKLAVVLAAAINWVHSTYLLPSGLLVAGYCLAELCRKRYHATLSVSGLYLLFVAPVVVYVTTTFSPTEGQFAEAQRILAEVRIPHHAKPQRWFDAAAAFQVLWMLVAWLTLRRTNLFLPIGCALTLAALGSFLALASDNPTLALMFPWRISAILIPLSTAWLVSRGCEWLARSPVHYERILHFLFPAFCVLSAGLVYFYSLGYREPEGEGPAMDFIAAHRKKGEVYVIPAKFPKPTNARGVYSATFTKAPEPTAVVYFEMARFRLKTGAQLYVDFKSIPYKDVELLEWNRRVAQCEKWFKDASWKQRDVVKELRDEGITHVVVPKFVGLKVSELNLVFEGGAYQVFELKR